MKKPVTSYRAVLILPLLLASPLHAREWRFVGVPEPLEAEFVGMRNEAVVLQGPNGKSFELPFERFSADDQRYLKSLAAALEQKPTAAIPTKPVTSRSGYQDKKVETLTNQVVTLGPASELRVTGKGDPISGSFFSFTAPDGWLFLENVPPSKVAAGFLGRMRVNGEPAVVDKNVRVAQYGQGAVIIPQGPDFAAMTAFDGKSLGGSSMPLKSYVKYNDESLGGMKGAISSLLLKRGYTATIASNENGTGISRNYVAQDHDLLIDTLPAGLDDEVSFVRIFPWRWTSKKGVAGGIW
jgi:hypothetical protein